MKLIEVTEFKFVYIPWDKNFPVKRCELSIIAKDRKEAELLAMEHGWKFFEQDCTCEVSEGLKGYIRDET